MAVNLDEMWPGDTRGMAITVLAMVVLVAGALLAGLFAIASRTKARATASGHAQTSAGDVTWMAAATDSGGSDCSAGDAGCDGGGGGGGD